MIYRNKHYTLLIFSADGTLTCPKSGSTVRQSPTDWQWLPGRKERLQQIVHAGEAQIVIATNEDQVASGLLKGSDMIIELTKLALEIPLSPRNVLYSFSHDDWRKPGPKMLIAAMNLTGCSAPETLVIGLGPDDEGAAQAAGCDFASADVFFQEKADASPQR